MKKLLAWVLCLVCAVSGAMAADVSDIHGFTKGEEYQRIILGSYPYEKDGTPAPLKWWVLYVQDGQALLMTQDVIDVQQVIFCDNEKDAKARKFRRITAFNESDLCAWMNGEMLDTISGDMNLRSALIDTQNGLMYPLTTLEYMNTDYGFPHSKAGTMEDKPPLPAARVRMAVGTPYAKNHELYSNFTGQTKLNVQAEHSPYWTATMAKEGDPACKKLQIVGYDGHLSWGVYSRINIGVRPSARLDLSKIRVVGGSGTDEDPWQVEIVEENP